MFISVGDARIFTTSFGSKSAPAIVGLGGWVGSWELWIGPFETLSETWRTVSFDHRGSGSTVAPLESITYETLVDDVFAVLDALDIDTCVLAGESLGALVTIGAALKQPARVRGLVLVDGLFYREPVPESDDFVDGLITHYDSTLAGFVNACVPEPDSDHLRHWGRQILGRAASSSAVALYRMGGMVDLRAQLHSLSQPTLILHGSRDAIVPLASSEWLATLLPHAQLRVYDDAGHVPTVTQPERVAHDINAFFLDKF